jgi:hypothetical protein
MTKFTAKQGEMINAFMHHRGLRISAINTYPNITFYTTEGDIYTESIGTISVWYNKTMGGTKKSRTVRPSTL